MNAEEIVRTAMGAFSDGDRATWEASLTPDCIYWEPCTGRKAEGAAQVADLVFGWKTSWPDLRNTETRTVAQGDEVAMETVWIGAQTGPLLTPDGQTLPATGKETVNPAAMMARVRDGKISEMHHYFDLANIMRQLGLIE